MRYDLTPLACAVVKHHTACMRTRHLDLIYITNAGKQMKKHSTTVLSAMMTGMNDRDDPNDQVRYHTFCLVSLSFK